jgi:hypothetical protein
MVATMSRSGIRLFSGKRWKFSGMAQYREAIRDQGMMVDIGLLVVASKFARNNNRLSEALKWSKEAYEQVLRWDRRYYEDKLVRVLGNYAYTLFVAKKYEVAVQLFLETLEEAFTVRWDSVPLRSKDGKTLQPFLEEFRFLADQIPRFLWLYPDSWQAAITLVENKIQEEEYHHVAVYVLLAELYAKAPISHNTCYIERVIQLRDAIFEKNWRDRIAEFPKESFEERMLLLSIHALWLQGKEGEAFELITFAHQKLPFNEEVSLTFLDYQRKMQCFQEALVFGRSIFLQYPWARMLHAHTCCAFAFSLHATQGASERVLRLAQESQKALQSFRGVIRGEVVSLRYHLVVVFLCDLFHKLDLLDCNHWLKKAFAKSSSALLKMSDDQLLSFQYQDVEAARTIVFSLGK